MKKKLVIGLSIAGIAALAIGNSLAYLQDQGEDVNVMTMGNVKIDQQEYERVLGEDGKPTTTIQEFTQDKPLYPYVGQLGWAEGEQNWDQISAPGKFKMFSMENVQDKIVFVKNTGRSDAYVRTWFALEMGELDSQRMWDIIGINIDNTNYTWSEERFYVEIDGNKYLVMSATYNHVLEPNEYTHASLAQVYLRNDATNEDVEKLDGNNNDRYDILVFSQAVQTKGFKNAKEALDSGFGEVSEETATELFSDSYVYVKTGEEEKLTNALKAGKAIYVDKDVDAIEVLSENGATNIDAKGSTVIMNGQGVVDGVHKYGYLAFSTDNGATADVKNLTVTGSGFVEFGHYGLGKGTYKIENLKIENFKGTLRSPDGNNLVTAAFAHYGKAELVNCVMKGTTSIHADSTPYDAGFVNDTETTIQGGEYGSMYLWARADVIINDAKVGTIDSKTITYKNYGKLVIGAGTTVDTINIIASDTYTPALTIEEGATVGTINYKGVSYSQAEWLSR